jgi:phage shock protein E
MMRILLVLVLALASCSRAEPPPPTATKTAKDPAAARALIQNGAAVVDVRNPEEFAGGHLPSAINVPVSEMTTRVSEVERLLGGDRSKPVVVYCGSGRRSAKAKEALEAAGFSQVVNGGGLDDLR